ncbi:MAG: hypothetical protein K8R54_02555 [Bacteroidales bacterium]|nr:hypothetical protein [Bacteroidales bacterium]
MNKNLPKEILSLLPFFIFFTILTWFVSDNIFFWDTVQLGSRHAHYFYENNFSSILLPDSFDSGHIPGFGVYLAFIWKIFGKTLFVSHFAMLPFIIGIVWQAYLLTKRFITKKHILFALALILADATLLSQFTLISPDVPLVFFFLTALNSVIKQNKLILSLSTAGLFLISMRGMMVSAGILVLDIIFTVNTKSFKQLILQLLKKSIIYLPAFLIFLMYSIYHYKVKGWIGYHEDSPWQKNFEITSFSGFLRNIGILIWRLLDFGRVFIWIAAIVISIISIKTLFKDKNIRKIFLIFLITLFSLSISFLLYRSLTGHRYILPVYLIFTLLASYLIFEKIKKEKLKFIIFSLVLTGMLSGNFWIYPENISQGWDSTLAHLHYYKLRNEMLNYMNMNKTDIKKTVSSFPNLANLKYLNLSNDTSSFQEKDLENNNYLFYSNIFNDFSDNEIKLLKTDFKEIKKIESFGVFITLNKKKSEH